MAHSEGKILDSFGFPAFPALDSSSSSHEGFRSKLGRGILGAILSVIQLTVR